MILKENERLDYVNDSLSLIQKVDGLTFGTDALLLAGYIGSGYKNALELGGGTGIISMLLLSRNKAKRVVCLEIQQEFSDLISRNAEYNNLTDRLECICTDVREYRCGGEYDLVFSNPPYMKTTSGRANTESKKNIARHEVNGDISDFLSAAAKGLKFGGAVAVVYRCDRLADLIYAMRENRLEPKRMTFIHADTTSLPSMVLVEARLGGKCGLKVTRPLFIYGDREHKQYTEDMNYIMENGSFPADFYIR